MKGANMNRMEGTQIVECVRLSSDGSGVGYIDGLATFIPGLLPGETGEVQLLQRKTRYQKGRLVQVLNSARMRQEPPCRVFRICGGCQLQHMNYEETLVWKRQWVQDALQRIGKVEATVNPTCGMEVPWRYRNKARLHRNEVGKLGYYQEKSNKTVAFPDCLLLSEPMNRWIRALDQMFAGEFQEVKDVILRQTPVAEGLLLLEQLPDGKEVSKIKMELGKIGLSEEMDRMSGSLSGLRSVWGLRSPESPVHIWGREGLEVWLQGLHFKVSPLAFLQINPFMTEKLYALVLERAELSGQEVVWDLYSGIGTLTLALARQARSVIGIEENPFAVEDARQNSLANAVYNTEFFVGKVENILARFTDKPDLVVLDPPRAGVQPVVIDNLLRVSPPRIIYVSCDPGTLARDVGRLVQGGYSVEHVQPVDMFPWTQHVETVVSLEKSTS
ncbi:MAG: 23S rRNA (uracil(1939)-C(5))-methyltransferase RlmD [Desulfitobacteriaceae bacterium]